MKNKLMLIVLFLFAHCFTLHSMEKKDVFTNKELSKWGYAWISGTIIHKELYVPAMMQTDTHICGTFNGDYPTFQVISSNSVGVSTPVCSLPVQNEFSLKILHPKFVTNFQEIFPGSSSVDVGNRFRSFMEPLFFNTVNESGSRMMFDSDIHNLRKDHNQHGVFAEDVQEIQSVLSYSCSLIVVQEKNKETQSVYVYTLEPFKSLVKICDIQADESVKVVRKFLGTMGAVISPKQGIIHLFAARSLPKVKDNFSDVDIYFKNI